MHGLTWIGVALLVLWAVLWLGLKIVSGIIHLILVVALGLLVWGVLKKGARAIGKRT